MSSVLALLSVSAGFKERAHRVSARIRERFEPRWLIVHRVDEQIFIFDDICIDAILNHFLERIILCLIARHQHIFKVESTVAFDLSFIVLYLIGVIHMGEVSHHSARRLDELGKSTARR